jgi:hypothetical protein
VKNKKSAKSRKTLVTKRPTDEPLEEGGKDWSTTCEVCDGVPTVHPTMLCGPCCFGDASTINGNW